MVVSFFRNIVQKGWKIKGRKSEEQKRII